MWLPGSAAQAVKGKFAGARRASAAADDTLLRKHPVHEALVDPMAEILVEDETTTRNPKDNIVDWRWLPITTYPAAELRALSAMFFCMLSVSQCQYQSRQGWTEKALFQALYLW
jgi:hypothetical protein